MKGAYGILKGLGGRRVGNGLRDIIEQLVCRVRPGYRGILSKYVLLVVAEAVV